MEQVLPTLKSFDLCVAGGGVFGLQLARQALKAGLSVVVCEARHIGSGGSGSVLGALMPHIPDRWNEKKQFQFEALHDLQAECEELEAETGLSTGYRRVGRLMPLRKERFLPLLEQRRAGAEQYWAAGGYSFAKTDVPTHWMDGEIAKFGAAFDTLAARLDPKSYLASLAAYVENHPKGRLVIGHQLTEPEIRTHRIPISDGNLTFDHIAISAGYRSFEIFEQLLQRDLGTGIKGQARVVKLAMPTDTPVIYDDGCYIVPHENGTVAIGSTSEKHWQNEHQPDPDNWSFFERALAICPPLREAPIIAEWAGVRPKCHEREPIIGRISQEQNIWAFIGGFKISFGIAHRSAAALVEQLTGVSPTIQVPESFTVAHHFKANQA
jgi:glycine/D-amino acid oxidase-like deaminating enzyme